MLEEIGFTDSVLFGGALRDVFLGVPFNDLDIRVNDANLRHILRDAETTNNSHPIVKDAGQLYLSEIFSGRADVTKLQYEGQGDFGSRSARLMYQGISLHLLISGEKRRRAINGHCKYADSPLNGVAMDKEGRIYAHPQFSEAVSGRLYIVDAAQADNQEILGRYARLHAKIPGLKFEPRT